MGALSRRKGKTFEQAIARDLRDALGLPKETVRRGLQSRAGGGEVPDVIVDGLPIHWECKHTDASVIRSALTQASGDVVTRRAVELPVVIVKRDRQQPLVFMYASDAHVFITAWMNAQKLAPRFPRRASYSEDPPVSLSWSEFLTMLKCVPFDRPAPADPTP